MVTISAVRIEKKNRYKLDAEAKKYRIKIIIKKVIASKIEAIVIKKIRINIKIRKSKG